MHVAGYESIGAVRSLARLAALFLGGCLVLAAIGISLLGLAVIVFGAFGYTSHTGVEILVLAVLVGAAGLGAIVAAVALI